VFIAWRAMDLFCAAATGDPIFLSRFYAVKSAQEKNTLGASFNNTQEKYFELAQTYCK
jgi:hypothetical protein